jgi:tRNA threonylcarbamoyladenosine biosynthesis protein TsaB
VRVLAIETATAWGSVAVVGSRGVLAERAAHVPGGHLEWLMPAIDAALAASRLRRDQIEGLAVSIGPGGFTGLRIGVATAASWAHVVGLPLAAVSTLEVIAAGVPGTGLVLVALDARRGEVAAALFRRDGSVQRLTPDLLLPPAQVRARLPEIADPIMLAGDALERHEEALLQALAPHALAAPREAWWPRAAVVGAIGRARLLAGHRHDPVGLTPHYAQRPVVVERRR